MNLDKNTQEKIDTYLDRLRWDLRGLPVTELDEIIEELRGHILDRASLEEGPGPDSVDAALGRLGNVASQQNAVELFAGDDTVDSAPPEEAPQLQTVAEAPIAAAV